MNLRNFKQNRPLSIFAFLLVFSALNAQTKPTENDTTKYVKNPKPSLAATRITKAPRIDGQPNDDCWKGLPVADDFIQHEPLVYKKSSQRTEVKVAYDDVAIYILAYCYDNEPDKIRRELSQRDNFGATDYVSVGFDTYDDDQNAFRFGVTAAGVQFDSRISNGNNRDNSWDAVWESDVSLQKDGWVAEYKIPFSALRFKALKSQKWGMQIARGINRTGEQATWAGFDPKIDGIVVQYANLTNLENIVPPLRLQFSPYLAAAVQRSPTGVGKEYGNQTSISGGMDLKYGINQSFTLDMTLIPNFGQVQSDNQILNLSPFEVQFQENRPFFTEGVDLFNKGDLFYSRRIGGTPDGFYNVYGDIKEGEILKNNPSETQLYNASKFSGRTNNNLGIGILNAVAAPMFATIEDTKTGNTRKFQTSVLTNYNIISLSQALKNNSEISFTNVSTVRNGEGTDANVTSLFSRIRTKNNNYEFYGGGKLSQIFEDKLPTDKGFMTSWYVAKVGGSWTYRAGQEIQSDKWNPNDLGFNQANNYYNHYAAVQYQQVEPNKVFLTAQYWLNLNHNIRFDSKEFQDYGLNGGFWGKFKNQSSANMWFFTQPSNTFDFFEAQADGRKFLVRPLLNAGINYSTDERKKWAWNFFVGTAVRDLPGYSSIRFGMQPRFRVSNQFNISFNTFMNFTKNEVGFARLKDLADGDIGFGRRDRSTVENTFSANYAFNAKSNLTFRARHYWSKAVYNEFLKLLESGDVQHRDGNFKADRNFNSFNIDMIYTWQVAPGSFLNLIWKNSIYQSDGGQDFTRQESYFDNVGKTFSSLQTNSLTAKFIYFIDYQDVAKVFKKKNL